MAWAQSDLDTLRAAAAKGVRKVTFADGRSTEFQDLGDIMAAIQTVSDELAKQNRTGQRRRRTTILRVGKCR